MILVHITSPPEEDPRSRVLASAIREYMQADPGSYPAPESYTEIQPGTDTDTDTDTGTAEVESDTADTEEIEEIHPPPPKPSSTPFTTHLTPTLTMLSSRLPLSRFYRPAWQTRPLSVWERGYWLFSYTGLDPDPQHGAEPDPQPDPVVGSETVAEVYPNSDNADVWPFISQIIQQGKAGWGVWAVRKRKRKQKRGRFPVDNSTCQIHHIHSRIQVYCWGEVVPWIYLLFLVGGGRRFLTGTTLQWRDAGDQVVVQM